MASLPDEAGPLALDVVDDAGCGCAEADAADDDDDGAVPVGCFCTPPIAAMPRRC